MPCTVPPVLISSLFSVLIATSVPSRIHNIVYPAELVGKLLLLVFFGSIGNSAGNILATLRLAGIGALFVFGLGVYVVHLSVILGVGKTLRIPLPDLLLASNANIGNAATAAALASSMGWKSRLLPAILVGNLGNFLGTFLGIALGTQVLRPMGRMPV